ncbi:MAG: hypothetical protein ACI9MX_003655 [Candidatus Aldehydirespiratoraceae bacterium]|jgi:uncharacterized protein (DUF1800 family)
MVPTTLSRAEAAHLLRRSGYGGTSSELTAFTGKSLTSAVDAVLGHRSSDPIPFGPDIDAPSFVTDQSRHAAHRDSTEWWVHRMASVTQPSSVTSGELPIHERMAYFWHDHFACGVDKVGSMPTMWDQVREFRFRGLREFDRLVRVTSLHPAMLINLDNHTNHYFAEQENFARELMELYTCGVGNYTEEDVVSMARAWTGHSIVGWNGSSYDHTYEYRSVEHNHNNKTIFGITANWNGVKVHGSERDTITELINGVRRTQTSEFIARKLFRYFAHYAPSSATVTELGAVMRSNGMEIAPVVRAIFHHSEFWSTNARHALIKNPVDFVATWVKRLGLDLAEVHEVNLTGHLEAMGQELFEPPSVAGWGRGTKWMSTAGAWARGEFLDSMRYRDPVKAALPTIGSDDDPLVVTQQLLNVFGLEEVSSATRNAIREWFQDAAFTASSSISRNRGVIAGMAPEFHVY